jgi:hypothetical protein
MLRIFKKKAEIITYDELFKIADQLKVFQECIQSTFIYGKYPGSIISARKKISILCETENVYISVFIPPNIKYKEVYSLCVSYWKKYCFEKNLFYNKYRFMEDDKGIFVEAIIEDKVFTCDLEHLILLRSYKWHYRRPDNRIYAQKRVSKNELKTITFRSLIENTKNYKMIYLDGNSLNNRKYNLQFRARSKKKLDVIS